MRILAARFMATLAYGLVASLGVTPAEAQGLGTFRWQLQPFCNVVSLVVVQQGATYALTGFDDQCGDGAAQSGAVGAAFLNPDGSIGMGLTIVTPGGPAAHVDVVIQLSSLSGTWRDADGNTGPFLFNPGTATGAPRPAPSGGGGTPAPGTVTTESLAAGAVTTPKLADGAVNAVKLAPGAVGAAALNPSEVLTGVTAGPGLTGGGSAGSVVLGAAFGGTGVAPTVARSDHRHTYARVVTVAASDGDFTSVAAALTSITDASSTNPYLVQVMPGVYLETALVQVQSFVHVRGSGPNATVIASSRSAGSPGSNAATVELLESGRISDLTVRNTGTGTFGIALYSAQTTRATVVDTVVADAIGAGGTGHYAAYWNDAEAIIRDSTLFAGGATGFGVGVNTAFGSVNIAGGFPQALIERSILMGGSASNLENCNDNSGTGFGVQLSNSSPLLRHSYVCGGHRGVGVYTNGNVQLQDSAIKVSSTGSAFLFEISASGSISVANSGVSYVGNKFTGAGTGLRCVHNYNLGTYVPVSDGTTSGTACN
jgi:hypothetical protein